MYTGNLNTLNCQHKKKELMSNKMYKNWKKKKKAEEGLYALFAPKIMPIISAK